MLVVFGICFCNALSWGQLSLTEPQALWRRRQWQPTLVLLPGKSHGWRGLVGCSPWGCEESDTTEWLHFHFSLSCIGEGNGNPLLCSCLENPMGGGAWWAANDGVAQNQTQLKRLSSSSSRPCELEVPVSPGGQVVVTENVHKVATLFLAQLWFLGQPEHQGKWASQDVNSSGMCLSNT